MSARTLISESTGDGSQALDPVARLHLGNGARMDRINWMADGGAVERLANGAREMVEKARGAPISLP